MPHPRPHAPLGVHGSRQAASRRSAAVCRPAPEAEPVMGIEGQGACNLPKHSPHTFTPPVRVHWTGLCTRSAVRHVRARSGVQGEPLIKQTFALSQRPRVPPSHSAAAGSWTPQPRCSSCVSASVPGASKSATPHLYPKPARIAGSEAACGRREGRRNCGSQSCRYLAKTWWVRGMVAWVQGHAAA